MADVDPFAEFEQVEEKKVDGQAPQAISNYIEEERQKLQKVSSFSQLKDCFPAEFQETAEKAFYKR